MPAAVTYHQALATPSRAQLLHELQIADEPQTVRALAVRLDLSSSTVRSHLRILEEAGLVSHQVEQPTEGRTGRPRHLYRAVEQNRAALCPGANLLLGILASLVEDAVDDPEDRGRQAGRRWGQFLVGAEPFTHVGSKEAVERLVALFEAQGFSPTVEGDGVSLLRLQACPFRRVDPDRVDVLCAAHVGLIEGAVEQLGAPLRVVGWERGPQTCTFALAPTPNGGRVS